MYGFGKVLLSSLLASGALAMPWAQSGTGVTGTQNTQSTNTGPSTEQVKSQTVGGKIGVGEPIPPVSETGPKYSLLLAKEVSPTDLDGVIVAWAYGLPFCTQRQLLSESIEDFCNKNLTFDRVPKLDENLQATGEVTQISGYFAGCSDDVSLGRSYQGLFWVELVGMDDGIGDQPASQGGTDAVMRTTSNTPPPTTQNTQQSGTQSTSGNGNGNGGVRGGTENPPEEEGKGKAFKCNNDRESHECPRGQNTAVDIVSFASCGQYAYTDKKPSTDNGNGGGGGSSGTGTQSTTDQQSKQGGNMGGKKFKTLRALKA